MRLRLGALVAIASLAACGERYRAPRAPEVATSYVLGPREADPIAPDPVWLVVPYAWEETCAPPLVTVTSLAPAEDGSFLVVLEAGAGCPIVSRGASISQVRLGELGEGHYRVRVGALEGAFDVSAADTDPGPLADDWAVRLTVARAAPPGVCFGMPSPESPTPDALRLHEQSPRTFRRIARAYPDVDVEALYALAARIDVVQRGADRWEYGYTDGACCTLSERGGEVLRAPDGSFAVSPPRTYSQRSVDC